MTPESKALILRALSSYRSDDYERAKRAFSRHTPAQMQEQYGHSGKTCQELLDMYKRHVDAVEAAVREVEAL